VQYLATVSHRKRKEGNLKKSKWWLCSWNEKKQITTFKKKPRKTRHDPCGAEQRGSGFYAREAKEGATSRKILTKREEGGGVTKGALGKYRRKKHTVLTKTRRNPLALARAKVLVRNPTSKNRQKLFGKRRKGALTQGEEGYRHGNSCERTRLSSLGLGSRCKDLNIGGVSPHHGLKKKGGPSSSGEEEDGRKEGRKSEDDHPVT